MFKDTILTLAALTLISSFTPSQAQKFTLNTVALRGETAPDDNGNFTGFGVPSLNNSGQAAFVGFLNGTSGASLANTGIFLGDGVSGLAQIARGGQAAPDGNGSYSSFRPDIFVNDAGQVAFFSDLTGTIRGSGARRGIFRGDGLAGPVQIVRTGQLASDGGGSFTGLGFTPTLNNVGQVGFLGILSETIGGAPIVGLYYGDGATDPTQIVRKGQPTPDGNGNFAGLGNLTINDSGRATFAAGLDGTSGGIGDDSGIFQSDGSTVLTKIVREGQAAPDGNGTFSRFINSVVPVLNNSGQSALLGILQDAVGGAGSNRGIFRDDGLPNLTRIARGGEAAPDGNGRFSDFGNPALNDAGQVAFNAFLAGTNGSSDSRGIFRGDGLGSVKQIVREGQAAPDGNGSFAAIQVTTFTDNTPTLNNIGQVAFSALLTGTSGASSDDSGIFLHDDSLGLIQVVREGDVFLGSTITEIEFNSGNEEHNGLNDLGQIAYGFVLADGRRGIAIASLVPEPTSLLLGVMASAGALLRRRRAGEACLGGV